MSTKKFYFKCKNTGYIFDSFREWFDNKQQCPDGSNRVDVIYNEGFEKIKELISTKNIPSSLWHYFDFLPLNDKANIVTKGEGIVPIERWNFLENFAKEHYGLNCQVNVLRNDCNRATGTFKDKGASLAASVLKENGIEQYIMASTGNTATAFANYLASAGISLSVFLPQDALIQNESEVNSYGQKVFKVNGDYSKAKKIAKEYSEKYNILMTGGNFDPLRIEAKKTMVFEWLRELDQMPTVYIQALSGGTGPFAIEKAYSDLEGLNLVNTLPRFILSQPDKCNPMSRAWAEAKAKGFPEGFENNYPVLKNPKTLIPTLATGDPKTYPAMSKLVKKSNGEIISFNEESAIEITQLTAYETSIKIGPASAISLGGFFEALEQQLIKEGDIVLVNIGEGVNRAADYMNQINYTTQIINSIDDCKPFNRSEYKKKVWEYFYTRS